MFCWFAEYIAFYTYLKSVRPKKYNLYHETYKYRRHFPREDAGV